MEQNIKDRFIEFLKYLKIGQNKFEKNCNIGIGTINNIRDGISSPNLSKIIKTYPELNLDWLVSGEGEMLKSLHKEINVNNNDSKIINRKNSSTSIIDENKHEIIAQEKKVPQYQDSFINGLTMFTTELGKLHELQLEKDKYVEKIINNCYERNEKNMERIDAIFEQLTKVIEYVIKK